MDEIVYLKEDIPTHDGGYCTHVWHCPPPIKSERYRVTSCEWKPQEDYQPPENPYKYLPRYERHVYAWEPAATDTKLVYAFRSDEGKYVFVADQHGKYELVTVEQLAGETVWVKFSD
jgi:hypothetical protein